MHKFDLALFGEDGRNGIVKDITDVKSDIAIIKSATGLLRQILTPVLASLITAGIMYLILRG
jgi:fructose-specific phosphotransferase system IIC component